MRWTTCKSVTLGTTLALSWSVLALAAPMPMSLEQRVACHATLEDLRWEKREWPANNPASKPARSDMLDEARIQQRVIDSLQQEAALAERYGIRLDAHALQTELNRIARQTRAPGDLQRIFAALGSDPDLIAECLVRPHLAQARLREAYAWDEAIHADQRAAAKAALAARDVDTAALASGARRSVVTYLRHEPGQSPFDSRDRHSAGLSGQLVLDHEEFERLRHRLLQSNAALDDALRSGDKAGTPGHPGLRESRLAFEIQRVLRSDPDSLTLETLSWPKRDFEQWWVEHGSRWSASTVASAPPQKLKLPAIAGPGDRTAKAAADSWRIESFPEPRRHATAIWTGSEMIIWGGDTVGLDTATGSRYDPVSDSWTPTSMVGAPNASRYHQAVWTGSEMIVWGLGSSGVGYTAGRYHPASDTWSPMSLDGAPAPRESHSSVWTGVELLVWGGSGNSWPPFNSGGRYDPETDSWLPTSFAGAPSGRNRHTTVWTGSEMIVWGGCGEPCPLDDGARYDPATDSWTPLPSVGSPSARYEHAAVWTGSEMILWGGCCMPIDGGRFDPGTNQWSALSTDGAPSPRYRHTAVWSGEAMLVWGGYWGHYPNSVGAYHPATDTWTDMPGNGAPPGRELHVALWTGDEMIIWGGGNEAGKTDIPGGRFSPATGQWIPVAHSQAPPARHSHTAVWSGNELLIWGGIDQTGTPFPEGARYEPATDLWSTITATDAPAPRNENRAVWTGSEMVVWGGLGSDSYTTIGTGGRYDPTLGTWSAMTQLDAPAPRFRHGMDWSGTEVIVWGGWQNGSYEPVATGARYDPQTDSWLPMSQTGAPAPRGWHASVWTGTELLVWGGAGQDVAWLGDGARYSAVSNAWHPLDTANAPSPRFASSSVWSGTEWLVWGGYNDQGGAADGARYDPAAESWATIPAPPSGLAGLSETPVIWTGSELIAWGGYDTQWMFVGGREGGRYDPLSDSWLSTSLEFAPERRFLHTITWTGSSMLVWGGCCTLASLGVYYPYPTGEPSTTSLAQLPSNPVRWSESSLAQVIVTGASIAPIDGRVMVSASTGESCSRFAADTIEGAAASYSCSLSFTSLGPRSIEASFSHSSSHLDSSAAPVPLSVMRFADLMVSAGGPDEPLVPGAAIELGVHYGNTGPDEAPGTRLLGNTSPALDGMSWSCIATGTAVCPAASGSGAIDLVATLPVDSGLDFWLSGSVPASLGESFHFNVAAQAATAAPHHVHDPQPGDNALSLPLSVQLIFRNGFE